MNALRKLLPFLRPYRRRLVLALGGIVLLTWLSALPPLVLQHLIDEIATPGAQGRAEVWEWLLPVVAIYAFLPVIVAGLRFVSFQVLMLASQRFVGDLRLALYRKILNASLRYHGEASGGMLVSRLMDDVNMLQTMLTGETVRMVVDSVIFIFSLVMVYCFAWQLGVGLTVIIILYVGVYRYFAERIRSATQAYRSVNDRIAGRLQETVAGVRQVRIYNREDWETELFLDRTTESLDKHLASSMSSVGLSTACQGIAGYGSTLIYSISGYYVLCGAMDLGDLLAVDRYVWMAISPAIRLTSMAAQMSETFVSVRRVQEVLEKADEVESPPRAPRLPRGRGAVAFRDVEFGYAPGQPLYQGLTLEVPAGATVALVGHTGCGKTTLTSLLMRYWDVQGGAIEIDGIDIRTVGLKSLRDIFGVVLQSPVIFDGTLAENIAYGDPGADRERILNAARTAEIHELVSHLPEGLDTVIGTHGIKLSVGEKQRLSIARAILKDPVILVMDEATSSLDSHSEALIQKALGRVLTGRTSFVVAHRLSTITGADQIVVMDAGAIVEQGTHEELLAMPGGTYQKLYEELQGAARGGEV